MNKVVFFILLLGVSFHQLTAQFVYQNKIYSPVVKTVILHKAGDMLSEQVIDLNKKESLVLEFDVLSQQTDRYEYTLIHCNSDWTQSSLEPYDYIEGFENQPIENYSNSFNTIERYVHYTQKIPSSNMSLTKSGNYIIKVYKEGNPNAVIFTKRMYAVENASIVELSIKPSSDAGLYKKYQQVDVRVSGKNGRFYDNPEERMNVFAVQNGGDCNTHHLKINSLQGERIDYSFDISNQFTGGNEFRFFDITSLRKRSQNVINFDFSDNQNHVYLREERVKSLYPYSSEKDLNGKFYIRNEYENEGLATGDYAWVHFTLALPMNSECGYYVIGDMNDWQITESNRMQFTNGKYRLSIYLKQGYYNYKIVSKKTNSTEISNSDTEGDFSETNNRYKIFVYYRNFADNYDELVGFSFLDYNVK